MSIEKNPLWFIVIPLQIIGIGIMTWQLGWIATAGICLFVWSAGVHDGHVYNQESWIK